MELGEPMYGIKITLLSSLFLLAACAPRQSPLIESSYETGRSDSIKKTPPQSKDNLTSEESKKTSKEETALKYTASASANAISSWEIAGALAARNQKKGWNASMNWLQRGINQYQIRLFGPLGNGNIIISKQGNTITYKDGSKTTSSSNADDLLRRQTGIRLPVNNLYYWVRGLPAPGPTQALKRGANNQLILLKQSGYLIEYGQYTSTGQYSLPTQIKLIGNGVFIKLTIRHWKI